MEDFIDSKDVLKKSEIVYRGMKNDIINCKYGLKELINEKDIAEKYEVSKTPVREAFSALIQEGYLIKYPRLGYFIKELKLGEYYKIIQLRFILESGVVRYIISSVSDDEIDTLNKYINNEKVDFEDYYEENMKFHLGMASLLDNEYIYDNLKHAFYLNTRNISIEYYKKVEGDIHKNHKELIKLLKDRDVEAVIKVIREELHRTDDKLEWF